MTVELADAEAVLQRHAGQGNAHRHDGNAIEDVVETLELEAADQVGNHTDARGGHVRARVLDATDKIDRRITLAQQLKVTPIDRTDDLQPDGGLGQNRRCNIEEALQAE